MLIYVASLCSYYIFSNPCRKSVVIWEMFDRTKMKKRFLTRSNQRINKVKLVQTDIHLTEAKVILTLKYITFTQNYVNLTSTHVNFTITHVKLTLTNVNLIVIVIHVNMTITCVNWRHFSTFTVTINGN